MKTNQVQDGKKYVKTFVEAAFLEKLKYEMDTAEPNQKYAKYKGWLHYANLQRWQSQGWHFGYVNYMGTEQHCTCGLAVPINPPLASDIDLKIREQWKNLDLDITQLHKGHKKLPGFVGTSPAIIFNFNWIESTGQYLWDALCQKCGALSLNTFSGEVDAFVFKHNLEC